MTTVWRKSFAIVFGLIVSCLLLIGSILYIKQDQLVQEVISTLNEDFSGRIEINDSHISPFVNFPYLSIDFEQLKVYEGKEDSSELLFEVEDAYVGFNLISMLDSDFEIKKIKLQNGYLKLVQHKDGTFNISNALSHKSEETHGEALSGPNLDLQSVEMINLDLLKINEANDVLVETLIEKADAKFKSSDSSVKVNLKSQLLFNLILGGDTSFLHDKHLQIKTAFEYNMTTNILKLKPSELQLEKANFKMEGSIDVQDHMKLDLHFNGQKPNFDLFFAFAPPEIEEVLKRYDNGGSIYFDARIAGKSIDGYSPAIDIDFGCEDAFVKNSDAGKTVDDLFFKGHFTNGEKRDASTMVLEIEDFTASPETGIFKGNVAIQNFDSPEFEIQLLSEFDLDFLTKFFGIKNLEDISGEVALEMNFHDIIDLSKPEKSIERLNESYFTKLTITNLSVNSSVYPLPIKNLNVRAEMDGHKASIQEFRAQLGRSDVSITASISDLPAILHHTDEEVDAVVYIKSDTISLKELTTTSSDSTAVGIDELITQLSLKLKLNSSARAFTESPHLPLGEFFIEELHARLTNYPHELHDFNADILIDSNKFKVIDFTGMLDESDFHFSGQLDNYGIWFEEFSKGETRLNFSLSSDLIQLDDLFTYGGENYVPEDYRHEELTNLQVHAVATLAFDKSLQSTHLKLDKLETKLKVHPVKFREVSGEFLLDSTQLEVINFKGLLGNSDLQVDARYFFNQALGSPAHQFSLKSKQLDFDELFSYDGEPSDTTMTPEEHEDVFNLFALPFSNANFILELQKLKYHTYLLRDFYASGSMTDQHYVYVDSLGVHAAGGTVELNGYFNGSDPKAIYFSPQVKLEKIDLDQLLFKFENFGQDHLVSENVHGEMSGSLGGKVHLHADLVPILDDAELHLDVNIVNGSLQKYSALEALSDYFADKNLSDVRFDTLHNRLDLKNGILEIPQMNINSSLGYIEISGEQTLDMDMKYYVSVPLKLVTTAGLSKLFGKKNQSNQDETDEIKSKEDYRKSRFLHLKIEGTPEAYKVSLGKKK